MYWLDVVILGILGISVIYSFVRGVIREVFSFLAIIMGYMVATRVYGYGAPYLKWATSDSRITSIISFIAVFIVISFLVGALGRMVHTVTKKAKLSFVNRILGALFGFCKGVIFVSILLLLVPVFSQSASQGQLLRDSTIAPLFDVATEALSTVFPTKKYGSLDNRLTKELRQVRKGGDSTFWKSISRTIQQMKSTDSNKPSQTEKEERELQKILKQ